MYLSVSLQRFSRPGEPSPHPFQKPCLDTLNIVAVKINFLILLKGKRDKTFKNH